jgi:hypothetical protein
MIFAALLLCGAQLSAIAQTTSPTTPDKLPFPPGTIIVCGADPKFALMTVEACMELTKKVRQHSVSAEALAQQKIKKYCATATPIYCAEYQGKIYERIQICMKGVCG